MPGFVPPALATLKPKPPRGAGWVHEIKFDGYRLQAQIRDGKAKLLTRSGQDWTDRFGAAVTEALAGAAGARPRSSTASWWSRAPAAPRTSRRCRRTSAPAAPTASATTLFDLLYLDGEDLRAAPLIDRKERLAALLDGAPPTRCASASISRRTARSCCATPAG